LLLGLGAGCTTLVALLLRPILTAWRQRRDFPKCDSSRFFVLGLFIFRGLTTFGAQVLLARVGNRIIATVQARVFDHLLRQNMLYFQDRYSSEFVARLSLAANGVRDSLQVLVQALTRDIFLVVGLVGAMLWRDPLIGSLALCALPIAGIFLARVIRRVRSFARRSFDGSTQIIHTIPRRCSGCASSRLSISKARCASG